jgi:hypothetical protein
MDADADPDEVWSRSKPETKPVSPKTESEGSRSPNRKSAVVHDNQSLNSKEVGTVESATEDVSQEKEATDETLDSVSQSNSMSPGSPVGTPLETEVVSHEHQVDSSEVVTPNSITTNEDHHHHHEPGTVQVNSVEKIKEVHHHHFHKEPGTVQTVETTKEEHHHHHHTSPGAVQVNNVSRTVSYEYEEPVPVSQHEVYKYSKVHVVKGADWINHVAPVPGHEVVSGGVFYVEGTRRASSIRYLSFCGVDDSVDPRLLGIISCCYPLIEFAILMRPEMAGQPRYASPGWIERLGVVQTKTGGKMKIAAHLCGSLATEVLSGDDGILKRLTEMNYQRVQVNATSSNGVDSHDLGKYVESFLKVASQHPELEISLQRNEETRALWEGVLSAGNLPNNVSMLFDESKGMGIMPESWPIAPRQYQVGYAGGIGFGGRHLTKRTLKQILGVGSGQAVWVSMESSMRCTKNGKDVFDIDKCYDVIDAATECNIHLHPGFIA